MNLYPARPDPASSLADRMGAEQFVSRSLLEAARQEGDGAGHYSRLSSFMSRFRGLMSLAFRLSGLYRLAYRQYHGIELRHNRVFLDRLPRLMNGFRILQLSDLHIDLDLSLVDTLRRVLSGISCDLCVITGDFRDHIRNPLETVLQGIAGLSAVMPRPTLAVLGNHDPLRMVEPAEAMGMRFLLNEKVRLGGPGDSSLYLAGIDDPNIYRTHDLARATRGIPSDKVTVLLSHSPAIHGEAADHGIDLVLAGHTHGGQICAPGGRILLRNDASPREFLRGPWRIGRTQGYTSTGTGACGVPLRMFCRPEITMHTLLAPVKPDRQ